MLEEFEECQKSGLCLFAFMQIFTCIYLHVFGRLGRSWSSSLKVTCLTPRYHIGWIWQEFCSYDIIYLSCKFLLECQDVPRMLLESMPSNGRFCLLFTWGILGPRALVVAGGGFNLVPQKRFLTTAVPCLDKMSSTALETQLFPRCF